MTALNRYFSVIAVLIMTCLPAMGQEADSSAEGDLKRAELLHSNYKFAKAEEYYSQALKHTTDSGQNTSMP